MNFWLFLIPLLSAFTGWIIVWIFFTVLFHPSQPKTVLGFVFQGIFPKKQPQIANELGKLVSRELFTMQDITKKIADPANVQQLLPFMDAHIDHFLKVKLKESMPLISMFIGDKTVNQLKAVFLEELTQLFPNLIEQFIDNLKGQPDLEKFVIEKVQAFPPEKLEEILHQTMSAEIRLLGSIAAMLGLLIGFLQLAIALLAG
ncbi:DUF445 domain-containing protein [Flavihumibacter fluvii]|uniref:DUF445 domain-containing protein n=1 Tax=Flavihumibacter fluvii TaxID=2838157 RepID=UPI001BDEB04F|nr:DUF445 domain-containing protein [Flavihumibacter fluvii]ULQ54365.1 DUF445 domain-containing protein [Flavihumibacter fluvii]